MRNKLIFLTACVLMAVSVFAQQESDGVEDIMNELMNYKEEKAPDTTAVATAPPVRQVPADAPAKVEEKRTPPPAKQNEIPATVKKDTSMAELKAPIEETPKQVGVTDSIIVAGPGAVVETPGRPIEEEALSLSDDEIRDMDLDQVFSLIKEADQKDKETIAGLQELADLIENDPGSLATKRAFLTWLKNAPSATWTWLKNASSATGTWFNNLPESTRMYMAELQEDRAKRKRMDRGHRIAATEGIKAVDDAWSTDLVLRTYDLVSGAAKRMRIGNATNAVSIKTLFSAVDFPQGASAIYQPATETIFVNNTRENLAVAESMLKTMGVLRGFGTALQVEIEAKFVEVSEGTLAELGFQWNFEDPTSVGNLEMNDGANGLFADSLRGSPANSTLPFNRKIDLGDGTTAASGDWSSFRFVDTFNTEPASIGVENKGGTAFDVMISALDQSSGADVLSAPRILTRSGEEATIQVGELHYFPEVFEGDSAQATIVNVSYEDFKEKLLGVELTVTPKVTDERDIMLELNPRITELAGWQSYQLLPGSFDSNPLPSLTKYEGSHYNHRQLDTSQPYTDHDAIVGKLPIFKKREIKTQVTIADGSTIGMGGLIDEKTESFDDRVPVLGSIPLIGRLFRNEGERVVKRNLIMFVNAKIIDPNGMVDSSRSFE